MPLILNIDTAVETAIISIAENGVVLASKENQDQRDHAAWLHTAIQELLKDCKKEMTKLNAVAISNGPGSYTGLRVGLSAAKGICYALELPLIDINTLQVMAHAGLQFAENKTDLLCPMIDARRMEVFTALYNYELKELVAPAAVVLDENFMQHSLKDHRIIFFGNGSDKLKKSFNHPQAIFKDLRLNAQSLATLSYRNFLTSDFAQLAYNTPQYIKDFYRI